MAKKIFNFNGELQENGNKVITDISATASSVDSSLEPSVVVTKKKRFGYIKF
jgi:hypothetical protein